MANNIILFYSGLSDQNVQNLSADLCVDSSVIVNCTVSLTSTLDYSTFAPYDSVECVLINRPNVHSSSVYEYNLYSFMRVGTNPALTNAGANSTNATAIAVGPLFYISEVADIGGGMRKIKGVSALALLDTEHYSGGYWTSSDNGNAQNAVLDLSQNWHKQDVANNSSISIESPPVSSMVGLINMNTNRNALGQIFTAYGWHVTYNRNTIENATLWISTNPSNFCTYTMPVNRVYVGNNLDSRAQSAGYRVNIAGFDFNSTTGCINTNVLNLSEVPPNENTFVFTCSPVLIDSIKVLIGTARMAFRLTGGGETRRYYTSIFKDNLWVPIDSYYTGSNLVNTNKLIPGSTVNLLNDCIDGYNMPQYFSNVSPCEITVSNLEDFPFPWSANSGAGSWQAASSSKHNTPCYTVTVNSKGGNVSTQLLFRGDTLNVTFNVSMATGGGGLSITDYNISDIGIISTDNGGQTAQNVLRRVSNFASAESTEKLSFPWNGARPGDLLTVDNNRTGLITDMTITLSNLPKATANIRIGYDGS